MYPTDCRYTRDHEWVRVEDDICVVGVTDFAQQELGEVVFVELPDVGRSVDAGEEMGTLESVKAVSELVSPVAGEVVAPAQAVSDAGMNWIA